MTNQPSIAELSRQVAEAKGYREESGSWRYPDGKLRFRLNIADPARLWGLEGELQQAGWTFGFDDPTTFAATDTPGFWASWPAGSDWPALFEPGTPEGRVRLVLRAWLEMNGGISG